MQYSVSSQSRVISKYDLMERKNLLRYSNKSNQFYSHFLHVYVRSKSEHVGISSLRSPPSQPPPSKDVKIQMREMEREDHSREKNPSLSLSPSTQACLLLLPLSLFLLLFHCCMHGWLFLSFVVWWLAEAATEEEEEERSPQPSQVRTCV